ncbi:MAG: heavy-metal-associated domain-containing protein [Terriglobia bacterium]
MSVAVKKIPGVESVKVSLNKGLVTIHLKPGNSADLEQIRKAVTDQGFKPKKAKIAAAGELAESNGRWLFKVTGTADVLPVSGPPQAQRQKEAGTHVVVRGSISAPPNPEAPGVLKITQVSNK